MIRGSSTLAGRLVVLLLKKEKETRLYKKQQRTDNGLVRNIFCSTHKGKNV